MIDALVVALERAKELADLAETLTGCRSDDEFVWEVQKQIDAALALAKGEMSCERGLDGLRKIEPRQNAVIVTKSDGRWVVSMEVMDPERREEIEGWARHVLATLYPHRRRI